MLLGQRQFGSPHALLGRARRYHPLLPDNADGLSGCDQGILRLSILLRWKQPVAVTTAGDAGEESR